MVVGVSVGVGSSRTVPASSSNAEESLTRAAPSMRQKLSASSDSTRLHCGQRFICWESRFFKGLGEVLVIDSNPLDKRSQTYDSPLIHVQRLIGRLAFHARPPQSPAKHPQITQITQIF